jgi:type II secretory pathway component GspD/PulD (secretin)
VVKTSLSRIVPNWQLNAQPFSTGGVESTEETIMKQILLTLWVITCVLRLPAADSTNASAGISPAETISEIISLKHAGAWDVADALNYLSGRGPFDPNRVKPFLRRAAISLDRQLPNTTKATADLRSNSLLIFASQSDLESIRRIVAQLDVARKQILIEATIFEVRLPNGRNARGDGPGRLPAAAADHFLGDDASWVIDFVPVVGRLDGFSYVAGLSNEFSAMVTSLLRDGGTNVDILQKPRLRTSDGMPGNMFVGLPVAHPPNSIGSGNYYSPASYQQLSTGLWLTVTPTINSEGLIAVELKANFNKFDGKTPISGAGDVSTTSTSEAQASAVLRVGDVLLIGGAIPAPQKQSSGQPESELMVLLRATVISDSSRPRN